ncbi:MAG: SDR family oxidoreductase [Oligoflexales bacterium]|nr:SDR family oxidoreductase [Oligoflexales bacterium]
MKRVLVTGGTRGIGEAIVREFSGCGSYEVVFTYRNNGKLAADIVADLRKGGKNAEAFRLDLSSPENIKTAMHDATMKNGFDIVIHNAGFNDDAPFFFMDEHKWQSVITAGLNSFYYINKASLENMIQKRWGRIISIVSLSGEAGNRGQTNYSAAKGAVIAATKSLAKEVARKGVLVNAISPGLIETDMTKNMPETDLKSMIPVGRMGRPCEVAKVARFLASDDASYINGAVIRVNGGLYT